MVRPFSLGVWGSLIGRLECDLTYTILSGMDGRNLTKKQAEELAAKIQPMAGYLSESNLEFVCNTSDTGQWVRLYLYGIGSTATEPSIQ
jgi:hypothetical protein